VTVTTFPDIFGGGEHLSLEMPRIARFVAEGVPHHITQRGNARQAVFDDQQDRRIYLNLLREYASSQGLSIWAWCLMTNHVHLLAVPSSSAGLARTLSRTHHDYACYRNTRLGKCGHLWQSRFYSCPIGTPDVWTVMAYIEQNPVRAALVSCAEEYPWSSAAAHTSDQDDLDLLDMIPWRENYTRERWKETLRLGVEEQAFQERIRLATMTGRPFGSDQFTETRRRSATPAGPPPPSEENPVTVTAFPDFVRSKHGWRDYLQGLAPGGRASDVEEQPQSRSGRESR